MTASTGGQTASNHADLMQMAQEMVDTREAFRSYHREISGITEAVASAWLDAQGMQFANAMRAYLDQLNALITDADRMSVQLTDTATTNLQTRSLIQDGGLDATTRAIGNPVLEGRA